MEEAAEAVEATVVGAGAVVEAAAGSSDPTSQTRVTTTGVDELAWAASSCRGLVRAGSGGERGACWQTGETSTRGTTAG